MAGAVSVPPASRSIHPPLRMRVLSLSLSLLYSTEQRAQQVVRQLHTPLGAAR